MTERSDTPESEREEALEIARRWHTESTASFGPNKVLGILSRAFLAEAQRSERFTSYRPGLEAVQTYLRGAYMTSKKAADILDNLEAFIVNELNAAPQVPEVREAPGNKPISSSPAESASHPLVTGDLATQRAIADRAQPCVAVPLTSLQWLCRRAYDYKKRDDIVGEAISMAEHAIPEYVKQLRESERPRQGEKS